MVNINKQLYIQIILLWHLDDMILNDCTLV